MNDMIYNELPVILLRTSGAIAISAVVILLLMVFLRPKSPTIHRLAWIVVLIQGCIFSRIAWDVPWYEPALAENAQAVGQQQGIASIDEQKDAQTYPQSSAAQANPARASSEQQVSQHENTAPGHTSNSAATPAHLPKSNAGAGPIPWWQNISGKISFVKTVLVLWLTGVIALIAIYLAGYWSLLRMLRQTSVPRPQWSQQWNEILRSAGVRRNTPMRIHDSLGPLICLGPTGYQMVVPRELWEELSVRQRAAVLNHEVAHYLRGDVWKSFLARVMALPHWFNPLAWMAVRKFEESGEWACDQYLIENDPPGGTELARALLRIVQFPQPTKTGIGFSSAGGSSLRKRVKRLCGNTQMEDSLMKRTSSILILLVVFTIGLAEVRLVARAMARQEESPAANSEASQDDVSEQERIRRFADRLAASDTDVVKRFRDAVATPAGQTALRERASILEFAARQAAQENAMPAFLDRRFEQSGEMLTLKPDQSEFRDSVLTQTGEYQADVDEIQSAIDEIANQINGEHEADKMLKRVLSQPMTGWVLYATEIRKKVRPDERTILDLYKSVFVVAPSGAIVVRPGMRAQVEEQLAKGPGRRKALQRVQEELKIMSDEISDFDEAHKQLKELFADEYFAAFCCNDSIRSSDNMDKSIENLFRYLDRFFEDHSDGRRLSEHGKQQTQDVFNNFKSRREAAIRLREPLKRFVSRIPPDRDELHGKVSKAFESKLTLAMLTRAGEMRTTSGARLVEQMIGERLLNADDGSLTVREDQRADGVEYARLLLQYTRALRRRLASVDDRVANIDDTQLREALQSDAGKYLMIRSINQQVAGQQFDGLGMWIDEHFTDSAGGYVPKEESHSHLVAFLEQVNDIREQLDKDDF